MEGGVYLQVAHRYLYHSAFYDVDLMVDLTVDLMMNIMKISLKFTAERQKEDQLS